MGTYLKRMETVVLLLECDLIWRVERGGLRVAAALEVGDKAPDFTLPSSMGAKLSLSQFRGKSWSSSSFTALTRRRARRTFRSERPTTSNLKP